VRVAGQAAAFQPTTLAYWRRRLARGAEVTAAHCTALDYDDPGGIGDRVEPMDRPGSVDRRPGPGCAPVAEVPAGSAAGSKARPGGGVVALIAGQDVEPVEGSDGVAG
jgi:hypothetical protein